MEKGNRRMTSKVEVVFADNGQALSDQSNAVIAEYKDDGYELVHVAHSVLEGFATPEAQQVIHKHWMTLVFEPAEVL